MILVKVSDHVIHVNIANEKDDQRLVAEKSVHIK